jgi:hypothetical protein
VGGGQARFGIGRVGGGRMSFVPRAVSRHQFRPAGFRGPQVISMPASGAAPAPGAGAPTGSGPTGVPPTPPGTPQATGPTANEPSNMDLMDPAHNPADNIGNLINPPQNLQRGGGQGQQGRGGPPRQGQPFPQGQRHGGGQQRGGQPRGGGGGGGGGQNRGQQQPVGGGGGQRPLPMQGPPAPQGQQGQPALPGQRHGGGQQRGGGGGGGGQRQPGQQGQQGQRQGGQGGPRPGGPQQGGQQGRGGGQQGGGGGRHGGRFPQAQEVPLEPAPIAYGDVAPAVGSVQNTPAFPVANPTPLPVTEGPVPNDIPEVFTQVLAASELTGSGSAQGGSTISPADSEALAPFSEDIEIDESQSAQPAKRREPTGREMLINVVEGEEVRIAIVRKGVLEELYMERSSAESHVGNIYKGRVTNVEPSIQAAFVDFGLGKNGFLHISDLHPQYFGQAHQQKHQRQMPPRPVRQPAAMPPPLPTAQPLDPNAPPMEDAAAPAGPVGETANT